MENLHKTYFPRVLEKKVREYLDVFPVVAVTGPRQSGKSTLLLHLFKNSFQYVSFDDYRAVSLFNSDPEKFMRIYPAKTIFDEVQKVPQLLNYIKLAVDKDRDAYGRFVLSGSNQLLLMEKVSESLAGRIGLLTLLPFQYAEIPGALREQSQYKGGYPELVKRGYLKHEDWYASYVETYLARDVRALTNVGDLKDFRRFMGLLSANTAQILNMSRYASDVGVSVSTIKRWLSVLEASYVVFLLEPYYKNLGKRIVKSPKVYFYDTGLAAFLTGVKNKELYEQGPLAGSLFENYIIAEVLKNLAHKKEDAGLFYYRTNHGQEVDLIIDRKGSKDWVEIKKSATFKPGMVKSLEMVRGAKDKGYLVYEGQGLPYTEGINIRPYDEFLSRDI